MVEAAVGDAGVEAVAQQIVDPIRAEGVADEHLGEDALPGAEGQPAAELLELTGAEGDLGDVVGIGLMGHRAPDLAHLIAAQDLVGHPLVVVSLGKELVLGGMGEGEMAEVMAEGRQAEQRARDLVLEAVLLRHDLPDLVAQLVGPGDRVVDPPDDLHHTE
jgi:hypothetical protein